MEIYTEIAPAAGRDAVRRLGQWLDARPAPLLHITAAPRFKRWLLMTTLAGVVRVYGVRVGDRHGTATVYPAGAGVVIRTVPQVCESAGLQRSV